MARVSFAVPSPSALDRMSPCAQTAPGQRVSPTYLLFPLHIDGYPGTCPTQKEWNNMDYLKDAAFLAKGLDAQAVERSRQKHGSNQLTQQKRKNFGSQFL